MTSPRPAYWRLTSLDTFTGEIWESSGKYDSAGGSPVGNAAPRRARARPSRPTLTQTFTISRLAELWLPAAYVPVSLQTHAFRARYQASSSTLIVDTNLSDSDSQTYHDPVGGAGLHARPSCGRAGTRHPHRHPPTRTWPSPGLSASAAALARQVTASAQHALRQGAGPADLLPLHRRVHLRRHA